MQKFHPGHKFSAKQRTTDVLTEEQVDFESLLLSPLLLKGLNDSGFEKPSPIQLKAIPLGRCGLDLIAQAKSGTGKTCVFSVIALENILLDNHTTQVLILAPTREIAVQIKDVVNAIGCHMKGLSCQVFIGGLPLDNDKKALKGCHIAVGSPGRIKSLIENKHLKTDSIRMFILDEADKLLDENFQEQVNWIFSTLPANKQMMAFSATYPEYLANHLTRYMREPTFVRLNAADPTLQGIKQFYCVVPFHQLPHKIFQEKVEQLLRLLSKVNFHQCLLFSNFQIRAQSLSSTLCAKGWPATFISGSQTQQKRLQAIEKLKAFKCRILISTDLTARGIDAENVNLVVNMDVPRDGETYLHRIGRAGRFGTKGVAVTFVAKGKEEEKMKEIEKRIGIAMEALPDHIPDSVMVSRSLSCESREWVTHDTVEVNVLHRSTTTTKDEPESKSKLTAGGKIDACIELNESKDDKESKTTQEHEKNVLHKNENLTAQNLSPQSTRAMPDGYENIIEVTHPKHTLSELGNLDNKQLEKHGLVEYGLAQNQDKVPELPSVDEFEKDFEEYLALASTFENLGLQEGSDSQIASVMDNLNFKETKEMSNLKDVQNYGSDKTAVDSEVDEKFIFSKASTCIRVDEDDGVNEGHISGDNDDDDGGGGDDYDNDDDTSVDDSDSDDDGDNDSIEDDEGSTDDSVDDDSIDNKSIDNSVVDANDENYENELEEDLKKGDHDNALDSHTKGQSCFSNDMLLKRSKKDKNYNDTEDIDVDQSSESDQSDKDHNGSSCIGNDGDDGGDDDGYNGNDDDDGYNGNDNDGYNGNDNGGDDGSGSGVGNRDDGCYDDDDDDDDDDSPGDGASPTCDNYEVLDGKKSRKKEMQLPTGYGASQGSEQNYGTNSTTFAQYYRRSTAPGYYWNTKYRPTHKKRCYPANTMLCDYPGMLPWQQVTCMHGDLNLRPNQQIYLRPSVFCYDSTGENKHYLPHPQMERTNGHFARSTENVKNKQRENQCHTKVHSPINEATLGQHRETFWSTTWHNAYHNINNAIQQFAAQNSQRY